MAKGCRRRLRRAKKWRNIDISDITDGSMRRTEELLAGGSLRTKPSESLFEISRKKPKGPLPLNPDVKKQRVRSKVLHIDSSVLPNPHTKPTGSSTRTAPRRAISQRKRLVDGSEPSRIAKSRLGSQLAQTGTNPDVFDIWQDDQKEKSSENKRSSSTGPTCSPSVPSGHKLKAQYHPSARSAVEPADLKSTSYIPTAEQQMKNEEILAKYQERLNRRKVNIESNTCEDADEKCLLSESEDAEDAAPDADVYENKILAAVLSDGKAPKVPKRHVYRKSKKVRDRERKLKLRELLIRRMERRKKFAEEFEKLERYQKMADERLERLQERLRRRKKILLANMYKVRKFGKDAYAPPKPRIVCADRPSASLRCIRADAFQIRDRFDSFRRRNLIG
ncbi:uncharacterized protein LOC126325502 [Schistocerca gregaria]|uniref:uncharacterized protein LOC126325502 n=1 Tax=Schistocerca gregaria TaxID=7010 RepID=UPI00211F23A3|nr:uncharacterized protein LOC126325502 [Schistocerca gregaria]